MAENGKNQPSPDSGGPAIGFVIVRLRPDFTVRQAGAALSAERDARLAPLLAFLNDNHLPPPKRLIQSVPQPLRRGLFGWLIGRSNTLMIYFVVARADSQIQGIQVGETGIKLRAAFINRERCLKFRH